MVRKAKKPPQRASSESGLGSLTKAIGPRRVGMCPGKGAVVELRNGLNQEAAGIETEAERKKHKSQVGQGPLALAKAAFPSMEPLSIHSHVTINLKITTAASPPPQTFPDSFCPTSFVL